MQEYGLLPHPSLSLLTPTQLSLLPVLLRCTLKGFAGETSQHFTDIRWEPRSPRGGDEGKGLVTQPGWVTSPKGPDPSQVLENLRKVPLPPVPLEGSHWLPSSYSAISE